MTAPPATAGPSRVGWIVLRLRAVRPFSLPVSLLPVLVAAAAARPWEQWDWPVLAASLIGVALLHSAGNLLNDYFDFRHGVDRRGAGDRGRPGRLLVRGELKGPDVLAEAGACLVLAVAPAAYLTWRCGAGVLAFALAAAAGLYSYTGPPLRLKHRMLGEAVVFLLFGPLLMLGAAYAQTRRVEWGLLGLSSLVGLAATAILVGNNIRDRDEDRAAGVRTLGQLTGGRAARAAYVALVLGCVFGLAGLAALRRAPRALLAAPALLVLLARPLACVWRDRRLADIDARTARFEAILLLAILAGYLLDRPG